MFYAVITLIVCNIFCALHGSTHAVARRHSLKHSNHLAATHASLYHFDSTRSFESEYQQPASYGRVTKRHIPGGRGVFTSGLHKLVTDAGKLALGVLKTGHKLILPPLKGVEWITVKATSAIGLHKSLLKSIEGTVNAAWKRAKAIEFPGKSIVALVFPNRIVSVVDKVTNDVMHFAGKTKAAVKATVAYTLYATLKVILTAITKAVKKIGFDCAPFEKTNIELNSGLINTVAISEGDICGLDTLQPKNNVTITKDDGSFMVITVPWVLRNLTAKIKSVDVTGFMGSIIKDQPVKATVDEISCKGKISFQKSTFLKFVALHLEIGEISGVKIKLEGAMEEGGVAEGIINGLAEVLGGVIQDLVNLQLVDMEKQISDYLLGISQR